MERIFYKFGGVFAEHPLEVAFVDGGDVEALGSLDVGSELLSNQALLGWG